MSDHTLPRAGPQTAETTIGGLDSMIAEVGWPVFANFNASGLVRSHSALEAPGAMVEPVEVALP